MDDQASTITQAQADVAFVEIVARLVDVWQSAQVIVAFYGDEVWAR